LVGYGFAAQHQIAALAPNPKYSEGLHACFLKIYSIDFAFQD